MKKPILCALLALVITSSVIGFGFRPISMDFATSGRGAGQTFLVTNTQNKPIAVRIRIDRRDMDELGADILSDSEDRFAVFPAQMILQPEQSQAVRVQWRGPSQITIEEAYRIIAEQVPVSFDADRTSGGSIEIMFRYLGAIYVLPSEYREIIEVIGAEMLLIDGEERIAITVRNRGNSHILLQDLSLTVSWSIDGQQASVTIPPEQLSGFNGENMLAGVTRRFYVDPGTIPNNPLTVDLDFSPVR